LTLEDVNLIINYWEDDWKNLVDKPGPSKVYEDQDNSEEEHDQMNDTRNYLGQSKFQNVGLKIKDKDLE
jgi:hypothetical protein